MSRKRGCGEEEAGAPADANPDYDDLVPLGHGPVATVLAGVQESTGEAFALKVYPGKLDRRTQAELNAELTKLVALRSQALVLVADRVEELPDGRCALRMELCAQSLPELVTAFGPLSIADTLALGQALAVTLAAVHGAGLVHGQVTPSNVLFRPSGEPVLSDFGLTLRRAFPCDPLNAVDYLPPETIRDGTADVRADLYGLGVILYLSLIGDSPHRGRPGEQPNQQVLRVLSSASPTVERVDAPPGLLHLVSSLLSKNPDARPIDAKTVANRLGALLGPVLPDGPEPAAPPPAPKPNEEPKTVTVFLPKPERTSPQQPAPSTAAPTPGTPAPSTSAPSTPAPSTPEPADRAAEQERPVEKPAVAESTTDTTASGAPSAGKDGLNATTVALDNPRTQQPPSPAERNPDVTQKVSSSVTGVAAPTEQLPIVRPYRPGQANRPPQRPPRGFDDFGTPPGPRPAGEPILVYGQQATRRRRLSRGTLASVACVLALVLIAAIGLAVLLDSPNELDVPSPRAQVGLRSAPASEVQLQLNTPTDLGDKVELNWRSSANNLRYAVIVASMGRQQQTLLADGESFRVRVDPKRMYCFSVQGTDGTRVYESAPRAIRGATCNTN